MSLNDRMFKLMAKHGTVPDAVYAVNWWQVLLADASIGLLGVAVGVAILLWWIGWLGVVAIVVSVWYLLLVGRRALQWRWLRREAGL